MWLFAVTLSGLLLSGFATATLAAPRAPQALRWGWAFGLGSGWLSLSLGAAALLGLPPSAAMVVPLVPIGWWAATQLRHERGEIGCDLSNALPPGLLFLVLLPAFTLALTTPLPGWDGLAIWGFKGRIFFVEDRIPLEYFKDPVTSYSHPEYPLHLPLLLAGLAKFIGRWEDSLLLAVAPVFYASLLLLLYGTIRLSWRPWYALLILAGVAPLPGLFGHIPVGYADLPLTTYVAGTLAGLTLWLSRGERGALSIAALSAGLGGWTKNEGLMLLLVCWVVAWIWAPRSRQPRGQLMVAFGLALSIALPWHFFRLIQGIPTEPFAAQGLWQLQRIPVIIMAMGREMAAFGHWGGVWIVAVAVSFSWPWLSRKAGNPVGGFFSAVLLSGLAAYVGVYALTPRDLGWHLATSLDRLLLHLLPAAALVVGTGIHALLAEDRQGPEIVPIPPM